MSRKSLLFIISALICCFPSAADEGVREYVIGNGSITRVLNVRDGVLSTVRIENRLAGTTLVPVSCNEFSLRLSDGTGKVGTDRMVTAKDFSVESVERSVAGGKTEYAFILKNPSEGLSVKVVYELSGKDFFIRKYLEIVPSATVTLEKIDVESVAFEDAFQNYAIRQITTHKSGGWRPGLGQPVYTLQTATFWGLEFPASCNTVEDGLISCGYLRGHELKAGETYRTYSSVVGVSDDKDFIDDAFYSYIDRIRVRPSHLQVQYNSWFDYAGRVTEKTFISSLKKVDHELVAQRGCRPLDAYVIDDGWEDTREGVNWADTVWKVNHDKFSPRFRDSHAAAREAGSVLGLWLSPGSWLGAKRMVPRMRKDGLEALDAGMSMTGERYMDMLEERIAELASDGMSYFKFDGLFGVLNLRDFELAGRGTPSMPQLELEGFSTNDVRLDDSRYDELKIYYLTAGTERLMKIFSRLHSINPEIYIAITNGAYLSPWWLSYVDVVWLINAGDAAKGKDRSGELVYRDHVYHQIWEQENTKFPMNSIFNHEPKKINSNESAKSFRDYLYMNLSRGTGFVELYIKTDSLSVSDWDIMAEGLKWAYDAFPAFRNVRMHGGNPKKSEVYGYSAWTEKRGYVSFHNPSDKAQEYEIVLDRKATGLKGCRKAFKANVVVGDSWTPDRRSFRSGDVIKVRLEPKEILLVDFR